MTIAPDQYAVAQDVLDLVTNAIAALNIPITTVIGTVPVTGKLVLNVPVSAVAGSTQTYNGLFTYPAGTAPNTLKLILNGTTAIVSPILNGVSFSGSFTAPTASTANTLEVADASNETIISNQVTFTSTAQATVTGAYIPQVFDPTTMQGQDFTLVPANTNPTSAAGINQAVFNNVFSQSKTPGVGFYFSGGPDGLWITSSQNAVSSVYNTYTKAYNWPQSGLQTAFSGASAGFGSGTFHWRGRSGQKGQGPGTNIGIMWRSDGGWIDAKYGGQATEIDVHEDWSMKGMGTTTLHFYDGSLPASTGYNGSIYHGQTYPNGTDDTVMHDYDLIWISGVSLEMFIDGVSQWRDTSARVPLDFADGDCNRSLGTQVVIQSSTEALPTVQQMIAKMWWSASTASPTGGTITPVTPVAGITPATGYTLTFPNGTTVAAFPGTLQVLITATNGATAANASCYWQTWNGSIPYGSYSNNPVTLDSSGQATINIPVAAANDYLQVVSATSSPFTPIAVGQPITLTPATTVPTTTAGKATGYNLTYPSGTSRTGAGTIPLTITANNGASAAGDTAYFAVFHGSSSTQNFATNHATLDVNGSVTVNPTYSTTNDYVQVVGNASTLTPVKSGTAVTIN